MIFGTSLMSHRFSRARSGQLEASKFGKRRSRARPCARVVEMLEPRTLLTTTWYVDSSNAGPATGSQSEPFPTIQQAINSAGSGDTVLVETGKGYNESDTVNVANLTIEADASRGATPVWDGSTPFVLTSSLLDVESTGVNFAGFTIQHYDQTDYNGLGAIFVDSDASLAVTDSTFSNNASAYAGAILSTGALTVSGSTFTGNSALYQGGAIDNYDGVLAVTNCTFSDNSAANGAGGAIFNNGSGTILANSFSGNLAYQGGAVDNNPEEDKPPTFYSLTINRSTFSANSAQFGGAVSNEAILKVTDSTFSGNSAIKAGAALSDESLEGNAVSTSIYDSTIADNVVSTVGGGGGIRAGYKDQLTLWDTIVALNTDGTGAGASADDIVLVSSGTMSSASAYNLIGTGGSGGLVNGVNGNQVGVANPGLDPNGLQNNGGPTETIALLPGSPAIDAGSLASPLLYDQRGPGYNRIVNGTVDIGAFEYHLPLAPVSITNPSTPRNTTVASLDVTFNQPIDPITFTTAALTLTRNGGPMPITGPVTLALVSGSTYEINGLAASTMNEGNYTLTLNAASLEDQNGFAGTGTISTSWLMDTEPPTSNVNPLPARETSLVFPLSVNAADNGLPPSGLSYVSIYVSTNAGPWTLWTNLTAPDFSANFTAQSSTTYAFYSIANDAAGNTEVKRPHIETSTFVPDLSPPVTMVNGTSGPNPTTLNAATGTFTLSISGTDPGSSPIEYYQVYASIDGAPYQEVGPYAIPAGAADGSGTYLSSITYQGLTDGQPHSYSFYSIGLDAAGNLESAPSAPNVTFPSEVFAAPAQLLVTGFTVEHGSPGRSFIRYLDLSFNETDSQSGSELTAITNSIATSSPDILLYKYDLNGDASSKTAVSLASPIALTVIDHAIEIDFGTSGIGGIPNTTAADGYYEVDIKLPGGPTSVHHFYRLLGDVNGDGLVDQNDLNEIAANVNETSPTGWTPLSADVNGDGAVVAFDVTLATRSKGRKLGPGLPLG